MCWGGIVLGMCFWRVQKSLASAGVLSCTGWHSLRYVFLESAKQSLASAGLLSCTGWHSLRHVLLDSAKKV